jgi:hypothetical protein
MELFSRNSRQWKYGTVNTQHQEHRYDAPRIHRIRAEVTRCGIPGEREPKAGEGRAIRSVKAQTRSRNGFPSFRDVFCIASPGSLSQE